MFIVFWWTALGLALGSLGIMAILILRRLWLRRRQKRDEARKAALKRQLFSWEEGAELPHLSRRDRQLLMELGHHLLNTLRGDEARRIARLLQQSGAVAEELSRLRKGQLPERIQAATLLADFVAQEEAVRAALEHALDRDRAAAVRSSAARALVDGGHPPALGRIIDRTWHPDEISVRGFQVLLRQYAAHSPGEISAYLQAHTGPDGNPVLLALLTDALSHTRDLGYLALLRSLATEGPQPDIRAAAFRALGSLGHPSARSAIAEGLMDASWVVRGQAVICASRIGLREFVPQIAEALGDSQWWVRFRAGQALLNLGPQGLARLRQAADSRPDTASPQDELTEEGPTTVARAVLAEHGL